MDERIEKRRLLIMRWVRSTELGWLLGIPLIIAFASIGEALGIGGLQCLVGAGMGAGVGWMQARELRGHLESPGRWALATLVALSLPFLVTDLLGLLGLRSLYSLGVCVICGGLLVATAQSRTLRLDPPAHRHWIVANLLGWSGAALLVGLADFVGRNRQPKGLLGAVLFLALVGLGGIVLGLATGGSMAAIRERCRPTDGEVEHGR